MKIPNNQVLDSCESTNVLAKQLAESGCPNGTWISCKKQTAGRGRHGRKWESLEGNLFLSVVIYVEKKEWITWIPIAAAVAVSQAVEQVFRSARLRIKWPNDLWCEEKKVGGILCEGGAGIRGSAGRPYVVVGLGLNVFNKPSSELGDFSDLRAFVDPDKTANENLEQIRAATTKHLLAESAALWEHGPAGLKEKYNARAVFSPGTEVEWGESVSSGTVEGLGSLGELCVRTKSGDTQGLLAEEVRMVRRASYGSHP